MMLMFTWFPLGTKLFNCGDTFAVQVQSSCFIYNFLILNDLYVSVLHINTEITVLRFFKTQVISP